MFTAIIPVKFEELFVYLTIYPECNVFFTWSKCHWCQKAQPEIERATQQGCRYPVLQLLADDHDGLQRLANLEGYPTIRRYSSGKIHEFNRPRTQEELHTFLNH